MSTIPGSMRQRVSRREFVGLGAGILDGQTPGLAGGRGGIVDGEADAIDDVGAGGHDRVEDRAE